MTTLKDTITARRAIVRFAWNRRVHYGLYQAGRIRLYQGSPFHRGQLTSQYAPVKEVRLLAPCRPSKIVCVGQNYREHARELGNPIPEEPLIFLKPPSAVIGPHQTILRPPGAQRVDHECELGVVIGRRCFQVTPDQALDHVLGYTCVNDVTERVLQAKDVQYTRAKGFDTFCPLGPAIALDLEPQNLAVRCFLDGQLRQEGHTSDMIFPVATLVSFVSQVMTLRPGDVIASGTPHGVGPMQAGQTVTVEVEGLGRLVNPVADR